MGAELEVELLDEAIVEVRIRRDEYMVITGQDLGAAMKHFRTEAGVPIAAERTHNAQLSHEVGWWRLGTDCVVLARA